MQVCAWDAVGGLLLVQTYTMQQRLDVQSTAMHAGAPPSANKL